MELTINIKEQQKIAFFIKLLEEFDYIEITDIKDDKSTISENHKILIDRRLNQIENGETSFQTWDIIKQKYEKKAI